MKKPRVARIVHDEVVLRVAGSVEHPQHPAAQVDLEPVRRLHDPRRRDGRDVAVQLPEARLAVDLGGAGDELRRIDEVAGAARVGDERRARQRLHELPRAAGVIEVHVRHDDVRDVRGRDRNAASASRIRGTDDEAAVSMTAAEAPPRTT